MTASIRSIAVVTSAAGSLINFRLPLLAALRRAGLTVYALAPDFEPWMEERLRGAGVVPVPIALERTGMRPHRDLRDMAALVRTLRRLRPDATLSYFIKPIIYGSLAAKLAGVRHRFAVMAGLGFVFTPEPGTESLKRRALRRAVSFLYRRGFGACERVFFHNADDLDAAKRMGLLDRAKAVIIPGTGIDLAHFGATPPPAAPIRFLLIGRLLKEKGVREYAEAARIVRADHPEIQFHLAGGIDSNPGALAQAEIEQWVAEGRVIWHGHVDDVRDLLRDCSVYVLPSYREGKPRSTQEAMAIGRAVITTDAPGCRDTVEEGVNGFKVPVGDAPALAEAMRRFIDHPRLIAAMGQASRVMAEATYDVHKINRLIMTTIGVEPKGATVEAAPRTRPLAARV